MTSPQAELATGPRGLVTRLSGPPKPRYSLCAMVTSWDEYEACIASFHARGFDDEHCERLVIDNSAGNKADAYVALNEFLQAASGEYIILHHQDILLLDDGRSELDGKLEQLDRVDPRWAVCGNAGHTPNGWPAMCISHPHRERDVRGGPFPVEVVSLDENFMVVRRVANLAVSADLTGFHHYGVDLCTIADILGWRAYVIDFHLRHKSGGTFDDTLERSRQAIQAKYRRAFRSRWAFLVTTLHFKLSGSPLWHRFAPWVRSIGKVLGTVPRNSVLEDAEACAEGGGVYAKGQRKA